MDAHDPLNPASGLPREPLAQAARWLELSVVHVLLGLLAGAICVRLMRARGLHWSWVPLVTLPLLALAPSLGLSDTMVAATALVAGSRARRLHREDLDAGADLAELAAGRRTPLDALIGATRRLDGSRRLRIGGARRPRAGQLDLGRDTLGKLVSIAAGGVEGRHALVVGATGAGKTVTQTWLAASAIEAGAGAVVIDPKGDEGMRTGIRRAAAAAGRPYLEWTPRGSTVYNPFASGGDTEIADKVLAGERFTEPHYQRQAQRYLGHVVRTLRGLGVQVSLRTIVEQLDPSSLERAARELPGTEAQSVHAYLDSLGASQRSGLSGVRDRLAILAESDVAAWLDPSTVRASAFDLLAAIRARATVYFNLQADSRPLLSQMLGAAIVQDLQTAVAALQASPTPTVVVIDEFASVAAEQVARLFARARSAGLSLLLGAQELADLRVAGREQLLDQVMGNLSTLIAHRQVVPRSAELVASLAGKRGVWKVSSHSDGRTTRTRARVGLLDADGIMRLQPGWSAVVALDRGLARAQITHVFSASERR